MCGATRPGGITLLLATQYLEEADQPADDILVIDRGQVIARSTADELKASVGNQRVEGTVLDRRVHEAVALIADIAEGEIDVDCESRRLQAPVADGSWSLRAALRALEGADISIVEVGLARPTLDDVFLTLTGRSADDEGDHGSLPIAPDVSVGGVGRAHAERCRRQHLVVARHGHRWTGRRVANAGPRSLGGDHRGVRTAGDPALRQQRIVSPAQSVKIGKS